jgi:hypothetical protein
MPVWSRPSSAITGSLMRLPISAGLGCEYRTPLRSITTT